MNCRRCVNSTKFRMFCDFSSTFETKLGEKWWILYVRCAAIKKYIAINSWYQQWNSISADEVSWNTLYKIDKATDFEKKGIRCRWSQARWIVGVSLHIYSLKKSVVLTRFKFFFSQKFYQICWTICSKTKQNCWNQWWKILNWSYACNESATWRSSNNSSRTTIILIEHDW